MKRVIQMGRFAVMVVGRLLLTPTVAEAQGELSVAGVTDAEFWATDARSRFLTRHDGHPAALGRIYAWGSYRPSGSLLFFVMAEGEAGEATLREEAHADIEQAMIQFTASPAIVLEAGKLTSPFGSFAARRLSLDNPLIGAPDGYPVAYPLGLMVSGVRGRWDYRFGAVSLPVSNERYVGKATHRLRPAVGAGLTLATGFHLGVSFTHGPYLPDSLEPMLPAGGHWTSFAQTVAGIDLALARGYTEIQAEAGLSRYEVPGERAVGGFTAYVEVKQTWSPRFFTAIRVEQNDYAFVRPTAPARWMARRVNFYNGELGLGYRLDHRTMVKLSYRMDHWPVEPDLRAFLKDGQAVALQISRKW